MQKWRKRLDLGSRRAIQRGIRELVKVGFLSGSAARIHYEPVVYYGTCSYTKRVAIAVMRNGTRIAMAATGPSTGDIRPWTPYWADIEPIEAPGNALPIQLYRVSSKPVVWTPRGQHDDSVISLWGPKNPRRKKILRAILGW